MRIADLKNYLSRPVRIGSYNWLEAAETGNFATMYPWQLFFNNQFIKYKLNNFAFMRCNLKVKIILNASPFYYGLMRAIYTPMTNFVEYHTRGSAHISLMRESQKPGVWLDPGKSEGAEMTLPFIYHKNFVNVGVSSDFQDLGRLDLWVFAPLESANGTISTGVSVQVYAWAEDIVLSAPTIALAMQGDEYGTGVVSAPASAVAKVASKMKKVPVIGKFAAATEIGARAVSGIAQLFGYTNVPVLDAAKPFRPSPFPQMASTEIGYPVEKLTVDSKNELSIDPSIGSITKEDELAVSYLVSRPCVVDQVTWDTSATTDQALAHYMATPFYWDQYVVGQQKDFQLSPMGMVSQMFNNWRGDLIFTFKIVASPFHKGRLRISYDPVSNAAQTAGDIGSVIQNTIVDIGATRDVEVRVPYQQATSWLLCQKSRSFVPYNTVPLTHNEGYDNGIVSLKVLTGLTAPVSTAYATIIVSVRGAENMEFANPCDLPSDLSPFDLQGDEVKLGETVGESDDLYRITFGEKIPSLRPLLHRSVLVDMLPGYVVGATNRTLQLFYRPRKIPFFGFDPHGSDSAKSILVPANTVSFQWARMTPVTWISRCFVGQRGAIHWHLNCTASTQVTQVNATRYVNGSAGPYSATRTLASGSQSSKEAFVYSNLVSTAPGTAMTNGFQQSGLSFSVPNASMYKFQSTDAARVNYTPVGVSHTSDGSAYEYVALEVVRLLPVDNAEDLSIYRYMSAGTDYNLMFFLNVQPWTILPTVTPS
nr:MAG: hypothetical protein 2 [Locarnavirus sp.]